MTLPLERLAGSLSRCRGLLVGQALVSLLLLVSYCWLDDAFTRALVAERRESASLAAVSLSGLLSSAMNERLALVRGLSAFVDVESRDGGLDRRFEPFAEALRRTVAGVRAITVAPDFTVRYASPRESSSSAAGRTLLSDPHPGFADTVQRAMVTGDAVLQGPVDLDNGVRGLIVRQIIDRPGRPWGAVGMVFDLQPVLDAMRLDRLPEEFSFLLRNDRGDPVAGDLSVHRADPQVERVRLTDGVWELEMAPRAGWRDSARGDTDFLAFQVTFAGVALLIELLTVAVLSRRRGLEREVKRRTRDLGSANRELERFAYVTAHDLQEPLRAIASYAQLLERAFKDRVNEEEADFLRQIVGGAARMKMLLRDVQLFLAEDRMPLNMALQPVDAALQAAQAVHARRIRETGATIISGDLPAVLADERRLREILVVLLGNAVEYRHPYRPVEVTVAHRRVGADEVIDVQDNGIGIEPQYKEQIFDVFRRLHSREEHPGTGMGLAIARKMAERMGGRITVDSTPGIGSTFSVHLPHSRIRGLI